MRVNLKEPNPDSFAAQADCIGRNVVSFQNGSVEQADDWIASEVPIALSYNRQAPVVMLATPMDLADFALGFSLSEAINCAPNELDAIEIH